MKRLFETSGQSLIEVLAVLSIAAIVISATVTSVLSSLSTAQYSRNQNTATQYAQQGMEIMRQVQVNNWNSFKNYSGTYCLAEKCTKLDNTNPACWLKAGALCSENIERFIREVQVEPQSSRCDPPTPAPPAIPFMTNNSKVTVTVYWKDSHCSGTYCQKVELVSCFSDNNTIPTP